MDDEGPGIPEGQRDRIWESYYRLRRDRDSAVSGSGIGLSVVRDVVERHGGQVWAEDHRHGGRFVVELPCEPGPDAMRPNPVNRAIA